MRETWYILESGAFADPREVKPDGNGRLVHSSGVLVAMRGSVPSSTGVDVDAERAKQKDLKPQKPKGGYKTREAKAE